ncbi:MAG: hypothetical protein H7281_19180 [Bacteriovorax sp.]|nr:hypothetical protein [Bacteriovorax sp.]
MEEKLNIIFQRLIGINFKAGVNRFDVVRWDSLNHVKLIIEVEKIFKVKFTIPEAVSILATDDLLKILSEKCHEH